jgi:hypothetical protein
MRRIIGATHVDRTRAVGVAAQEALTFQRAQLVSD